MKKKRKSTYKRVAVDKRYKHGMSNNPTYVSWYNMLTRCNNPNSTQYHLYGGAGIVICARWLTFTNFVADVGERPSKAHTLDRFPDRSGNYEPGNVRWATQREQCRNKRNNRAVIRSDGKVFPTLQDGAESVQGGHVGDVWAVCNGKGKTHRGFGWKYL